MIAQPPGFRDGALTPMGFQAQKRPRTVAIVDWTHLVEDFLGNLGLSFEDYCREVTGGWMFGYVEALASAGCRADILCVSARATAVTRHTHEPTGATIVVLPATPLYRKLRRSVQNPYAPTLEGAVGAAGGPRKAWLAALREIAAYASTPLGPLAREIRRYDAVICQEYENPRFDACVLLGLATGQPVFATFQGGNRRLSRLDGIVRPLTLRASAGLIVGTRSEHERLTARYGLGNQRIARIFNPLNTAPWFGTNAKDVREVVRASLGIPVDASLVAWHGRIDFHRKGLDVLIAAMRELSHRGDGVRLLIIGTGRDAPELRRMLSANPIEGLVWIDRYVMDKRELARLLSAADVYAFPSRHEGFPVAPIEAMACGIPVVAADADGVADIFAGGESSGGVVVPKNDAGAFACALARLLDNEPLRRELGRRARERVAGHFSLEAVGTTLRQFLFRDNALHDRPAGRLAGGPAIQYPAALRDSALAFSMESQEEGP